VEGRDRECQHLEGGRRERKKEGGVNTWRKGVIDFHPNSFLTPGW